MRNKKVYIPIVFGLVLLAIGYFALRSDVPTEPIVIYKATTPLPKQTDIRDTPPSTRVNEMPPESKSLRSEALSEDTQRHMKSMDSPELLEDQDTLPVEPDIQQSERLPNVVDFKITPQGFPLTPYWDYPENEQNEWSYEDKLLDHVLVKLWREEGTRNFVGGSIELDTRRVRPHYLNTLYVEWEEVEHPDGSMVEGFRLNNDIELGLPDF